MTAKEHLMQVKLLDIRIQQKRAQVDDLKDRATSVSGQQTDAVRVQSSKDGDTIGRKVEKYADLEAEIEADTYELLQLKHSIINQIQQLTDSRYVELLYKRYVEYKRLELIAVEMNYDYDWARTLHGYALQAFADKYGLE